MTQKQNSSNSMTSLEKRSITGLASIFAFRMLGLFMILPVFSLAAGQYSGSTPLLIGLAIGAYGLTQALFQIPFGMLSDRIGRKRVITAGLLLFAAGSVVAVSCLRFSPMGANWLDHLLPHRARTPQCQPAVIVWLAGACQPKRGCLA
jgi:MFS family permease